MANGVKIVVKKDFHSFGKDFKIGDELDPRDARKWPKGTLLRRFENKFVEYAQEELDEEAILDSIENVPEEDDDEPPVQPPEPDWRTKTKPELAEYAMARFGVEVSENQGRPKMIEAIEALIAKEAEEEK